MAVTYRLRDDLDTLVSMQRASQSDSTLGLMMTHGLIGSAEWWSAVETGRLPVVSERGEIQRVWQGQHAAGPAEFEMRTAEGHLSRWLCNLDPSLAKCELLAGRSAFVEYVLQDLKAAFNGSQQTKIALTVSIE
jgi:hypothetical protein